MVHAFMGKEPIVRDAALVAWNADVSGEVELGEDSSVWYGVTLRGDVDRIVVGRRTNVQDGAVLHVSSGLPCILGEEVTVGHGAIVHACRIGNRCLLGMGAIILDGAEIGECSIVGAGSLVTGGKKFPPGSMILGSPARVVREVTEEERLMIVTRAAHYVELARATAAGVSRCPDEENRIHCLAADGTERG